MLHSMTGYGRSEYQDDKIFIKVDIKSVNSKGFDLKLKLPMEFSYKEPFLRSYLQKNLIRGKVDCYINIEREDIVPYEINISMAKNYYYSIKKLALELGYKFKKINIIEIIMRLPDVLKPSQIVGDEETWQKILSNIDKALEELIGFRIQEGKALEKDLLSHVNLIKNYLELVNKYEKERIDKIKQRLINALKEFNENYDKERFEQELIYYLEKLDISEEKVRLHNHINYFVQTIENKMVIKGKTLNFITQEMGREINTLGAKANHVAIQHLVVKMKDELEKIKEQIANVL